MSDLSNPERLKLIVARIRQVPPVGPLLLLRTATGAPRPFRAQDSHFKLILSDGHDRPYSLVNLEATSPDCMAPHSYLLGVRLDDTGAGESGYLHNPKGGNALEASAPYNHFPFAAPDGPVPHITGGITPLASMAAHLAPTKTAFMLHYAARPLVQLPLLLDFRVLPGPHIRVHVADRDGAVLLCDLKRGLPPEKPVDLCGPAVMIDSVISLARVTVAPKVPCVSNSVLRRDLGPASPIKSL